MAALPQLPNETLINIIARLPQRTLVNISATSKSFHQLVEPMLYTSILLQGSYLVCKFIRSVLERPQLARMTKHVTFRNNDRPNAADLCFIMPHVSWLRKQMRPVLRGSLLNAWQEVFLDKKAPGWWDSALCFLVYMFSFGLESIDLGNNLDSEGTTVLLRRIAGIRKQTIEESAPLSHLEKVQQLFGMTNCEKASAEAVLAWSNLNSVEDITINGINAKE